MPATDQMSFTSEQIPKHPGSCKGIVNVQLINPIHQRKIGRQYRSWQVIYALSRQLQGTTLLSYRQFVIAVDHLFALSRPALVSAFSKKSFSRVSSPNLGMQSGSLFFLGRQRSRRHLPASAASSPISGWGERRTAQLSLRAFCPP